jgi:20S proteasome subunit beta 2
VRSDFITSLLPLSSSCCGAGTAADTEYTTLQISSELELHRLETGRKPRVGTALRMLKQHLFHYRGYIGAYLVLGGVDITGPNLYTVHAHGSTDKLPYVSMGSGSLAAMATFEDRFRPNMDEKEAVQLVRDAIAAGIFNDLGSGSNVDICIITADKTEYIRPFDVANKKGERTGDYSYARGTTAVLESSVRKFEVTSETVTSAEPMES